jgi:predicted unusual protein kinase regulating ubiquinone biosynthesis (AarF/ABC1/UbiB family)
VRLSVDEDSSSAPADEVFARFEPLPFAAASIGQVHQARLHDGTCGVPELVH